MTHVLPAELLMSVGLAGVFIPAASTALIGVGPPRRRCRQRGAEHLAADRRLPGHGPAQHRVRGQRDGLPRGERPHTPADAQLTPTALIHGYHVAFFWGAALFTAALLCAVVLINAKKEDVPTEAGVPAA